MMPTSLSELRATFAGFTVYNDRHVELARRVAANQA